MSLLIVIFSVKSSRDGVTDGVTDITDSFTQGSGGPFAFISVFVAWTIFFLPEDIMIATGGYVYGFWFGLFWVSLSRVIATSVMLLLGRFLLRERVTQLIAKKHMFIRALLEAIKSESCNASVLIAASELPLTIKNYIWSVSEGPVWMLMLSHLVAGSPSIAVTIFIGAWSESLIALKGHENMILSIVVAVLGIIARLMLGVYMQSKVDALIEKEVQKLSIDGGYVGNEAGFTTSKNPVSQTGSPVINNPVRSSINAGHGEIADDGYGDLCRFPHLDAIISPGSTAVILVDYEDV